MRYEIVNRAGVPVASLEAWGVYAQPASATHWKEGRSAWELARAWTEGTATTDLAALLATDPSLGGLVIETAIAEAQTRFDDHTGGPRNHDLLVIGHNTQGPIVIGIEGKADETYGQTVVAYKKAADKNVRLGQPTNAPARLDGLLRDIVDASLQGQPELGALRYQLLTGIAGTLAEAQRTSARAVFLVHEFVTALTTREKRQANHVALQAAMHELFGCDAPAAKGGLVGPLHSAGKRWADTALWIGQLTTVTPTAGPSN